MVDVLIHKWHSFFFEPIVKKWGTFMMKDKITTSEVSFEEAIILVDVKDVAYVPNKVKVIKKHESFLIEISIMPMT